MNKPTKTDLKRKQRIDSAPSSFKALLERVLYAKTNSRSSAIKAMCAECNGFDRDAIAACSATACPLWHFRPYQKAGENDSEVEETV